MHPLRVKYAAKMPQVSDTAEYAGGTWDVVKVDSEAATVALQSGKTRKESVSVNDLTSFSTAKTAGASVRMSWEYNGPELRVYSVWDDSNTYIGNISFDKRSNTWKSYSQPDEDGPKELLGSFEGPDKPKSEQKALRFFW